MEMLSTMARMVLCLFLGVQSSQSLTPLQTIQQEAFQRKGDLNLGMMVHLHQYSKEDMCLDMISHYGLYEWAHSVAFAVDTINTMDDLLPNITLGYAIMDTCAEILPLAGSTLQMIPLLKEQYLNESNKYLSLPNYYDVVGVIGPTASSGAVIIAPLLGFFGIPLLGPATTSDSLRDRGKYPTFYRIVPPDIYQAEAIVAFIKELGFEYFVVLHAESTYGYEGNRDLQLMAKQYGICLEDSIGISDELDFYGPEFEDVVRRLSFKKARVVVNFVYPMTGLHLMSAIRNLGFSGRFIMVFTECFPGAILQIQSNAVPGSFRLVFNDVITDELYKGVAEDINPTNFPYNPWMTDLWEQFFGCSYDVDPSEENFCGQYDSLSAKDNYYFSNANARLEDSVYVFANAIHMLIEDRCPEAFIDSTLARDCVQPRLIPQYLDKLSIDRPSGRIEFNEFGESMRSFVVDQVQGRQLVPVAFWDTFEKNLTITGELNWDGLVLNEIEEELGRPESVCSKPCQPKEIYIQGEVICCWTCRLCRNNEITVANASQCETCADLTWPDEMSNYTTCRDIPPTYLSWTHPYGLGLTCFSIIGFIGALAIIFIVIKHRERRVIKGASRQLIGTILIGALLGFSVVPMFIAKPEDGICWFQRIGFNLVLTLIFAPLFLKTLRIYRIFEASSKMETNLTCVKEYQQMTLVSIIIVIQVGVIASTCVIWTPGAELQMPVDTDEYVELQCTWEVTAMLTPLSVNLGLLILCAIFSFLGRKLPDNFNESWYVFICVCTTLFIWIAFLITYFAAFYAFHKAVLLAFALYLNVIIVLGCLFGPKIYALYRVDDNKIKVSNFDAKKFEK